MHAETQINNIALIFPATPEKFIQYYGLSEAIELFHFFNMNRSHAIGRGNVQTKTVNRSLNFFEPAYHKKVRRKTMSMIEGHRSYDR
jgi:hypothetical protein